MGLRELPDPTPFSLLNYDAAKQTPQDWACGTYFIITAADSVIWGVRFYSMITEGLTVRGSLWEPDNDTAIATKDLVVGPAGAIYDIEFDEEDRLTVTAALLAAQSGGVLSTTPWTGAYGVSVYETTGTEATWASRGSPVFRTLFNQSYYAEADHWYGASNAKPKIGSPGNNRCFVDPIVYGYTDEY